MTAVDDAALDARLTAAEANVSAMAGNLLTLEETPAFTLIKNFTWSNADQNSVAKDLAVTKLSDDAAAQKWVDANPAKVQAWLAGS